MFSQVSTKYLSRLGITYMAKVNPQKYLSYIKNPHIQLAPLTKDVVEISHNTKNTFADRIHELSESGYESETLKQLFTPKYKPKRRINEMGFPVTTLIDISTREPVEVYIQSENIGKDRKRYVFYKEGELKPIGKRSFTISKELNSIQPGFMYSSCNDKYLGLGIREHQLAVEEAMLNGFDKIMINAISKAVPFHKKCLFEKSDIVCMTRHDFENLICYIERNSMLKRDKIVEQLTFKSKNDIIYLDYLNSKLNLEKLMEENLDDYMELSNEKLKLWQDMAKSQPILI